MVKDEGFLHGIIRSILPVLDKEALVLLTSGSSDYEAYQKAIDDLMLTKAKIVASQAFLSRLSPEQSGRLKERMIAEADALYAQIEKIDLIVIPVLTRNTLVKAALGIQDNLVTMALAEGFMKSIPVLGVKEDCSPKSRNARQKGLDSNAAYNRMLYAYEDMWRQYGATLVEANEFTGTFKSMLYPELLGLLETPSKADKAVKKEEVKTVKDVKILTMGEVQKLSPGQKIRLPLKTIITPLAADEMQRKQIVLERI